MEIKIQQSLSSSDGKKSCLIYNKDKDVFYQTTTEEETTPLLELLKDRPKAYFEAEIINKKIVILKEISDKPF